MKKIKFLSLLVIPSAAAPISLTSCSDVTKQFNFNQQSELLDQPLNGNPEFDALNSHQRQVDYIQSFNNKQKYVIDDFVYWFRLEVKNNVFINVDKTVSLADVGYNGQITVSRNSKNASEFNINMSIYLDNQERDIFINESWFHFAGSQKVEGHDDLLEIPDFYRFDLVYTNKTLHITDISVNNDIKYVTYTPTDGNKFILRAINKAIVPKTYECDDDLSSLTIATYTYQNWTFKE